MVEYAVLLVAIVVTAAFAMKGLGKEATRGATETASVVRSSGK